MAPIPRAPTLLKPSGSRPRKLGSDEATQRTHALLAEREAQAKAAESEKPGNEANVAPQKKKPTGHEHHP